MYGDLLKHMKTRPERYAKSTAKFWDDEHISRQMLEAHLDPATDAASRRHGFIADSARWIAAQAGCEQGKKLLDLGCGPGLYAVLFDDVGLEVTGLDISARSIDYALQQVKREHRDIQYRCMDYLDMEYDSEFDIAILVFCDFGVLADEKRKRLLGKIKRALKPGGMLVLDGFTARQYVGFTEEETIGCHDDGFWRGEPHVLIERRLRYDEKQTFLEQYIVVTEEKCDCYNIWNHAFSKESLLEELEGAGFGQVEFYGDVSGAPFSEKSKTVCAVARREETR